MGRSGGKYEDSGNQKEFPQQGCQRTLLRVRRREGRQVLSRRQGWRRTARQGRLRRPFGRAFRQFHQLRSKPKARRTRGGYSRRASVQRAVSSGQHLLSTREGTSFRETEGIQ